MAVQDIRICYIGDSFVNGTGDESCLGGTVKQQSNHE